MTDVSKIENFVDRLESLAGAYELSESFRKAISRCKLSITMYKMSDKYADEVYKSFGNVWGQANLHYQWHEHAYRKSPLVNYLGEVIVEGGF